MQFRYRFVPYGTRFVAAKGERHAPRAHHAERELFENELAADVGGSCWGHDGETLPVLDHHFYRGAGSFRRQRPPSCIMRRGFASGWAAATTRSGW